MQDTQVKDAVDQDRSATQQLLHKAISDAAAKRGGAVKADLQAVPQMAKAAADSIKGSMAAQNDACGSPKDRPHVVGAISGDSDRSANGPRHGLEPLLLGLKHAQRLEVAASPRTPTL
jgi:hypothetical protein